MAGQAGALLCPSGGKGQQLAATLVHPSDMLKCRMDLVIWTRVFSGTLSASRRVKEHRGVLPSESAGHNRSKRGLMYQIILKERLRRTAQWAAYCASREVKQPTPNSNVRLSVFEWALCAADTESSAMLFATSPTSTMRGTSRRRGRAPVNFRSVNFQVKPYVAIEVRACRPPPPRMWLYHTFPRSDGLQSSGRRIEVIQSPEAELSAGNEACRLLLHSVAKRSSMNLAALHRPEGTPRRGPRWRSFDGGGRSGR